MRHGEEDDACKDLGGADAAPQPLGGHLEVELLGEGEGLGVLGVFRAQVLVQVAADLGRDLERPQENEECPEQDGERLEHDLGHGGGGGGDRRTRARAALWIDGSSART